MSQIYNDPTRRQEFVLLLEVIDGNPNGDPAAGNHPRQDVQTQQGLMSDVSTKRLIRDAVIRCGDGDEIFIRPDVFLNEMIEEEVDAVCEENGHPLTKGERGSKKRVKVDAAVDKMVTETARARMCARYFDIRMFGAVLSTGANGGQVRGPMQIGFGRSIDPIYPQSVEISRVCHTNATKEGGKENKEETGTFGNKWIVPYGLYRIEGTFSPHFAKDTGVTSDDLERFWRVVQTMLFDAGSASCPVRHLRGLHVFTHNSALGDAPAFKTVGALKVLSTQEIPTCFEDYIVTLDNLPEGVTHTDLTL